MNGPAIPAPATQRTYVIAEIGVNHDGDVDHALELVEAVAATGADAVKIQTFSAETLVSATAPKAAYQLVTTPSSESQLEMLRRLELSYDDHHVVMAKAIELGLDFLSTPYDRESLRFLVHDLQVSQVKIASSDITNVPILVEAGRCGRKVILSTGMSTMEEIKQALAALAFGASHPQGRNPRFEDVLGFELEGSQDYLGSSVVLMQCTSQYPSIITEANLRAIVTLREAFGVPVGYSDHTVGSTAAIMSVALGSMAYEKHFTLDRTLPGPDHSASAEPAEFAEIVQRIREAESALGTGAKVPAPGEAQNRFPMRKSLFAARAIAAGAVVVEEDIALMRPEGGDGPGRYWNWIGQTAPRDFARGEPLKL